jgi:hypothetical protein
LWNRHQSRATDGKESEDWRLIDAYATVEECRRHRTRVIDDIWRSAEETQKLPGVIEVKIAVIETGIRTETLYEKPDMSRRDVNYFICRPEDASPTPLDP